MYTGNVGAALNPHRRFVAGALPHGRDQPGGGAELDGYEENIRDVCTILETNLPRSDLDKLYL